MPAHRLSSICPVANALDILGDRWTLLVVRDMIFLKKTTYASFLASKERIATNILADRLTRLREAGIIVRVGAGRTISYRLTHRGADLIPVLLEIIYWSNHHVPGVAKPAAFVAKLDGDRATLAREMRAGLTLAPTPPCGPAGPTKRARSAAARMGVPAP